MGADLASIIAAHTARDGERTGEQWSWCAKHCGWNGPRVDHPAHVAEMIRRDGALTVTVSIDPSVQGPPEGWDTPCTSDPASNASSNCPTPATPANR